jgi:hypothetical protein
MNRPQRYFLPPETQARLCRFPTWGSSARKQRAYLHISNAIWKFVNPKASLDGGEKQNRVDGGGGGGVHELALGFPQPQLFFVVIFELLTPSWLNSSMILELEVSISKTTQQFSTDLYFKDSARQSQNSRCQKQFYDLFSQHGC